MRRSAVTCAAVIAMMVTAGFSYAQGKGGGPKPRPTAPASHSTTGGAHAQGVQMKPSSGVTTHGSSGATHGASGTTTHGASGATKQGSSAAHASGATQTTTTKTAKATGTASPATSTSTTATTTAGATTTLTPVQQKLQHNTNLANHLSSRLPAGADLMTAAAGFRNLGQFVAAVNVSNNLGIPFADLKTSMVTDHKSLGQSIQLLKPSADATVEAQRAEDDAAITIRSTQTSTTTTTSTNGKGKSSKTSGQRSGGGH